MTHGSPWATIRHVGDLGNIIANENGVADFMFLDWLISLQDNVVNSIIGRGVTLHLGKVLTHVCKSAIPKLIWPNFGNFKISHLALV